MSSKMSVHSDKTFEMEYNLSLDRKPVGDGVLIYDFPEKGWSTMYLVQRWAPGAYNPRALGVSLGIS
jgi:hypothetical protein